MSKYTEDDFEDFRRYEAYQEHKNEAVVKGVKSMIYNLIMNVFIYFVTNFILSFFVSKIFDIQIELATLFCMFLAFFVFKFRKVKEEKFKSLITLIFICFLEVQVIG